MRNPEHSVFYTHICVVDFVKNQDPQVSSFLYNNSYPMEILILWADKLEITFVH